MVHLLICTVNIFSSELKLFAKASVISLVEFTSFSFTTGGSHNVIENNWLYMADTQFSALIWSYVWL